MADDFNNVNQPGNNTKQPGSGNFDPNRPRLKKVKRPIRRPEGSGGAAIPPKAPGFVSGQQPQRPADTGDDFNLDAILDDTNLPALNKEPQENQTQEFQPQFIDDSDITPPKSSGIENFISNNMFTQKSRHSYRVYFVCDGIFYIKAVFLRSNYCPRRLTGRRY